MSKIKTTFICQNCGASSLKWQGRCPACGEWNTFAEEIIAEKPQNKDVTLLKKLRIDTLGNLEIKDYERINLPDTELNRIIGGGLIPGSVTLIGGEPGIGKSTLMLQLALMLKNLTTLYISGEESSSQIKIRARRLGLLNPNCYLLAETNLDYIIQHIQHITPKLIIIDSIQTLNNANIESPSGSLSQIRDCTARISEIAKAENIPVFLIGHITKEGYLAGPKLLEHMVDTVLYFEGDRNYDYRILRTIKNRFGSVADLGIYEMSEKGLIPVKNPSEILLSHRFSDLSGIAISAMLEGLRPILIELQALVTPTYYGTPQRNATGFDHRRLSMLLAVLEKRCGIKIISQDVFFNVAGGLKISDTATDLGIVAALTSSFFDQPLTHNTCFAGEIGLSGEIRPVRQVEKRIMEAEKLGFSSIYLSSFSKIARKSFKKITIIEVGHLTQLLKLLYAK